MPGGNDVREGSFGVSFVSDIFCVANARLPARFILGRMLVLKPHVSCPFPLSTCGRVTQQEDMSGLILSGYFFFSICWGRVKDDISDDEIKT